MKQLFVFLACCVATTDSQAADGVRQIATQEQDHASPQTEPQPTAEEVKPPPEKIDFNRARQLLQKRKSGGQLSAEDAAFLERAIEARRRMQGQGSAASGRGNRTLPPSGKTGLIPLNEMSADDRYLDQDGGLYGRGLNEPPAQHRQAALRELAKIQPLDASGKPDANGQVVLISISMSNATQEFSRFKQIADSDSDKSKQLTIVDCAQGGQAMAEWVNPDAQPWEEAARRLKRSGVTPEQVQVAWIKLANKGPRGELKSHGQKLQKDTLAVIQNARAKFPNLRIAYLSSRIYGGYSGGPLNPEPYAYESAFAARWLILDQIAGNAELNYESSRESSKPVSAPLLLWGPYLWADGTTPRKSDNLSWKREDLAGDGTHPSKSGREKVGQQLLSFFKKNPLARSWFVGAANQPLDQ